MSNAAHDSGARHRRQRRLARRTPPRRRARPQRALAGPVGAAAATGAAPRDRQPNRRGDRQPRRVRADGEGHRSGHPGAEGEHPQGAGRRPRPHAGGDQSEVRPQRGRCHRPRRASSLRRETSPSARCGARPRMTDSPEMILRHRRRASMRSAGRRPENRSRCSSCREGRNYRRSTTLAAQYHGINHRATTEYGSPPVGVCLGAWVPSVTGRAACPSA